jgi:hypothetical protein
MVTDTNTINVFIYYIPSECDGVIKYLVSVMELLNT